MRSRLAQIGGRRTRAVHLNTGVGANVTHVLTTALMHFGYLGILLAMTLESACIPIPSEIIMPFAGYLAVTGHLNFWGVVMVGTLGNLIGSLIAYYVGKYGGRAIVLKYGRRIRLSERHLKQSEAWFAKNGEISVLVGRVFPVVRTFISLPAGIAQMHLGRFITYTIAGSIPWVYMLAWAGSDFGKHWQVVDRFMRPFTDFVVIAIAVLIVLYIVRRVIMRRRNPR